MTPVSLLKARRVLRTSGPAMLIRLVLSEVRVVEAYRELGRRRTFDTSAELWSYATTVGGGVVAPFQSKSEILWLLERIRPVQPKVILEIGTANGGTLLLFARSAHPSATIISIDLPGEPPRQGYAAWRIPLYKRFALPTQSMHLLRGDSHDPATRERVEALLDGRKIDLLFIDGDHSYEGVRADFELFRGFVRSGGWIALHDISQLNTDSCQVFRFWSELKETHRCEEFVEDPDRAWYGIGLLQVP
jgi:cephalosporin hydroxylase